LIKNSPSRYFFLDITRHEPPPPPPPQDDHPPLQTVVFIDVSLMNAYVFLLLVYIGKQVITAAATTK
jgi:hypothetical protein